MLSLSLLSALAMAEPTPTVFDAANELPPAVAVPAPEIPGVLRITLTDHPLTCDDVASTGAKEKEKPNVLTASFDGGQPGTRAAEVALMQKEPRIVVIAASGAVLTEMPDAKGGTGKMRVDLEAPAMVGGAVSVQRDVPFVLCDTLVPRPSLTGLEFVDETQRVDDFSGPFTAKMPKGWVAGKGPTGSSWAAPDGRTFLDFSTAPAVDGLEASVDTQVKAFQGNGWSAERHRFEKVDEGFVAHWSRRFGDGPEQHTLEVYRYTPKGSGVKCEVTGDTVTRDQVFAQMEKACLALAFSD